MMGDMMMDIKKMEYNLSQKLKKYEKDKDNRIGILLELSDSKDHEMALIKMNNYLDNPNTSKTRNDLIEESERISKNT